MIAFLLKKRLNQFHFSKIPIIHLHDGKKNKIAAFKCIILEAPLEAKADKRQEISSFTISIIDIVRKQKLHCQGTI